MTGEIQARGASITPGYLSEPERTAAIFDGQWLRTGDLGHLDKDGFLWIDGRISEFVKVRGARISFAEIEARVRPLTGVHDVGACRLPHPEAGEAIGLLVVTDGEADSDSVSEAIRGALPRSWTCGAIVFVAELPRNARGKLDRPSFAHRIQAAHAD